MFAEECIHHLSIQNDPSSDKLINEIQVNKDPLKDWVNKEFIANPPNFSNADENSLSILKNMFGLTEAETSYKDSLTTEQKDNIKTMRMAEGDPTYWLQAYLNDFAQKAQMKNYNEWILKMKFLHLIKSSRATMFVETPEKARGKLSKFVEECIKRLKQQEKPNDKLIKEIQKNNKDLLKEWLEERLEKNHAKQSTENKSSDKILLILRYLYSVRYTEALGEEPERYVFQKLMEQKDLLSGFVVIQSLDIYTSPGRRDLNREHDFLLLSAERKVIIAIEIKRELTNNAKKQLEACKEMFEKNFQLDDEWTFYPVIFSFQGNVKGSEKNHVITKPWEVVTWLQDLLSERQFQESETARRQLKDIVWQIIFFYFIFFFFLLNFDNFFPPNSRTYISRNYILLTIFYFVKDA